MIEKLLASCLKPVLEAEVQLRKRKVITFTLLTGLAGILALLAAAYYADWWSWMTVFAWFIVLAVGAAIGLSNATRPLDLRGVARQVEEKHPDLQAALLAAMDQKPAVSGELGFLQKRLMSEISEHAVKNHWVRQVSEKRLLAAAWGQFAAVIAFCVSIWFLLSANPYSRPATSEEVIVQIDPETNLPAMEVAVTPGDVEIEKNSRLVIEATFSGRAPASAMVVYKTADKESKFPMNVGLDETVFSALIPKVVSEGDYHITFENAQSDDFKIDVFEYPRLVQADATINSPDYLEEEPREVTDTRKITVMEGSRIDWKLTLNKPVLMGELYGEDEVSIPLERSKDDPSVLVASHVPEKTQRYRVHLIDNDDRANQRPPWITVNVNENTPPKLKLTFPGRDFDVSAVQELPFEAEVWDDVSVEKSGITYQMNDREDSITLSKERLAGGKKHPILTLVSIEDLEAKPRDLISYHFWAEDIDKEGNVRRTTSDLFFAEVRYFEEILREGQPQSGQGEGEGEGGESQALLKIQKDVINASWKLRRDHDLGRLFERYASDAGVVHESQLVVLNMIDPLIEKAEDPELKQIFKEAKKLIEEAAENFALVVAKEDGELIGPAHQAALKVYAKLIEASSRETEIAMSQSQGQGQSQENQRRNMNLELKQKDLKYEENTVAQEQRQTAEQQEDLAVLARLKELARRQEAIAEKIKELEEHLQDATEEEREEIERQLKRLQEEQQELLRELDDLGERMESEQNRPNMAEEREQLENTRENVQETAENLEEGNLAAAANSATRAREELKQMEEEFRERTSRQFSEEMRDLREKTRALAENQEELSNQLEELNEMNPNDPFSSEAQQQRGEVAQNLSNQLENFEGVLEEIRNLSEQSETSESLLSDDLYEAFRNAKMNGVEEALKEARDYTYYNRADQARAPEQAAARGIEELKQSIEAASEKILGNEADALRLARSELDRLIEESREEANRIGQNGQNNEAVEEQGSGQLAQNESGSRQSDPNSEQEGQPGSGQESQENENSENAQAGNSQDPSEQDGEGQQPGQEGQEGNQPSTQMAEAGQQGQGQSQESDEGQQDQGQPSEEGQEGQQSGQQPGEGQTQGQGNNPQNLAQGQQGQGQGQQGEGQQPGEGQQGQGQQPGQQGMAGNSSSQRGGGSNFGGDDRGNSIPNGGQLGGQPLFFDRPEEAPQQGPITGDDYGNWADRLSNIEEMVDQEDIRNGLAKVLDDARAMRIDFQSNNDAPQAGSINQRITNPLVELRQRLSEEIAKLNKENPIAPIDRDPVPSEFRDLVRRYYEELGSGE